jgi:hypothetical protein
LASRWPVAGSPRRRGRERLTASEPREHPSQISSVDKARLGERVGSLSGERVEQIGAGLRFQQASFFPR